MTARTDVQSNEGAILYIAAERPVTFDQAGYEDTGMDWVEIGKVSNFGEHGATVQVNTFTAVKDGIVAKSKGSVDYGTKSFEIGNLSSGDAGQTLLKAAILSKAHYSLKAVYPLGDGEVTNEKHYMDVLVTKLTYNDGDANNMRKLMVDTVLCKPHVVVEST